MAKLDWRTVAVDPGVLREPTPDPSRIIIWLPAQSEGGYRHWERIANVPGAEIVQEEGLAFTQATALPVRQKGRGLFGKLFSQFGKHDAAWLVPSGGYAEQAGERRTDLLLVWTHGDAGTLGDDRLRARWSGQGQLQRLGPKLFLMNPLQPGVSGPAAPLLGNPLEQAEELLAAARQSGDRAAETAALIDLGVAWLRGGDAARALAILEEAFGNARQLQERTRENDSMGQLALAVLATGQPARAQELLAQVLASARATGDRFQEKMALAHLGAVLASIHDFREALAVTDHALGLARELGDRHHEADLLWFQAIQNAELGRWEKAGSLAQSAIDIHATLRSPHVGWLTSQLKKYRPVTARSIPGTGYLGLPPGGYYTGPTAAPPIAECEPSFLRTALSAVKAQEMSAGSGIKTVPPAVHDERLATCTACPHHTGVRCTLSGQFTTAKAWLPYESCPIGKWNR